MGVFLLRFVPFSPWMKILGYNGEGLNLLLK